MSSRLTDRTGASAGTDRTGTERTGTDRTGAPTRSAASRVLVAVTPELAHTSWPCERNHSHQFWKFELVLGAPGGAAIDSWFSVDDPRNTDARVMSRSGVCDRSICPNVGPGLAGVAAAIASSACTNVTLFGSASASDVPDSCCRQVVPISGTWLRSTRSSGTERTGTDRTGTDRTGTDRTGTDRTGTDRTGTDRTGALATASCAEIG